MVDLNETPDSIDSERLLDKAGLPTVAKYTTPVIRYRERSRYLRDKPTRHLLLQLALSGDEKRMQVVLIEANRSQLDWEITRSRVFYGASEIFTAVAPAIVEAAGKLPHFAPPRIVVCSHAPHAEIHVQIRGKIDLERSGICQRRQHPTVVAGQLVISAAEKVLGEKIERAAEFD